MNDIDVSIYMYISIYTCIYAYIHHTCIYIYTIYIFKVEVGHSQLLYTPHMCITKQLLQRFITFPAALLLSPLTYDAVATKDVANIEQIRKPKQMVWCPLPSLAECYWRFLHANKTHCFLKPSPHSHRLNFQTIKDFLFEKTFVCDISSGHFSGFGGALFLSSE